MERHHFNLILGCVTLFTVVSTISAGGCAYPGPPDIELFLPHNKYCNLFYRLDKCPNGLVYNPSKQQCDLPANTNCGSKKILTTGDNEGGNEDIDGSGDGEENGSGTNEGKQDPDFEGSYSFIGGACPSKQTCPQEFSPNKRIFIPHSTSCNLFCSCVKGAPLLYRCQWGLHFNPRTRRCQYPSEARCSSGDNSGGNEINPVTVFPPISRIPEIWRRPVLIEGICHPKGKCPQYGNALIPHETACNLVCGCKDGISTLYRCPRGLNYNPSSKQCDNPSNSGCIYDEEGWDSVTETYIPSTIPTKTINGTYLGGKCLTSQKCPSNIPNGYSVLSPHLTVCNLFCACSGKEFELYACPKGLHFNSKTQNCDLPSRAGCNPLPPHKTNPNIMINGTGNGDCLTSQVCPANDPADFTIYLPHMTDCGFFCRCDHGMAKLDKCAKNLHFNPKKQSCDVPNNAICITTKVVDEKVYPTPNPGDKNNTSNTGDNSNGGQQEFCPAEGKCTPGRNEFLPHQRSCVSYCECINGLPKLRHCNNGQHFNPKNKKCEAPNKALCQGECNKLERREATAWSPSTCNSRLSKIGDVCNVKCAKGYELRGSSVITCTKQGWNGTAGLTIMPSCKAPEEVGKDIIDNVEEQAKGKVNFLFILDESLSLSEQEFDSEISFIKAIVSQFPLSKDRTAGVITFSGSAAVDIHMTHKESCNFFKETDKILYAGGSTDILLALRTAVQEVVTYSANTKTLVFLVTDGKSETNPTSAANDLKKKGHVLFTIGVGEYDRKELEPLASKGNDGVPLFFGLTNFKAFNKIAEYLHTVHGYGATVNCLLPDIAV